MSNLSNVALGGSAMSVPSQLNELSDVTASSPVSGHHQPQFV